MKNLTRRWRKATSYPMFNHGSSKGLPSTEKDTDILNSHEFQFTGTKIKHKNRLLTSLLPSPSSTTTTKRTRASQNRWKKALGLPEWVTQKFLTGNQCQSWANRISHFCYNLESTWLYLQSTLHLHHPPEMATAQGYKRFCCFPGTLSTTKSEEPAY